jgi:hypothetical protein
LGWGDRRCAPPVLRALRTALRAPLTALRARNTGNTRRPSRCLVHPVSTAPPVILHGAYFCRFCPPFAHNCDVPSTPGCGPRSWSSMGLEFAQVELRGRRPPVLQSSFRCSCVLTDARAVRLGWRDRRCAPPVLRALRTALRAPLTVLRVRSTGDMRRMPPLPALSGLFFRSESRGFRFAYFTAKSSLGYTWGLRR